MGTSIINFACSQAPAWEPIPYKLLLAILSGSWSFKDRIPKQELGNEQKAQRRKVNCPTLRLCELCVRLLFPVRGLGGVAILYDLVGFRL
ncbi:MAG: hypothetical protein DM484_11460 [Candidatus Methylumidiphilus alinenensis]|uniref:Uncharacterized protein n=1 Tax=Candidatus Methylumidiphilus alinenensis TaxID=2202197 RepID=A0A2W4T9A3_9GAMM|nr:MAG: hypothetical protein DM484_11460 [Candidatus Methylumidiphilus alinenensis]